MKRSSFLPFALALAASACLPACMVSPWDDYVVADKNASFPFMGYHLYPGSEVELQVLDPVTGDFDTVVPAQASTTPWVTNAGDSLYSWFAGSATIDEEYWRPGSCSGSYATVRAYEPTADREMYSVRQDFGDCWNEVGEDLNAFSDQCTAQRSPLARVVTSDFSDYAPRFDDFLPAYPKRSQGPDWFTLIRVDRTRFSAVQMRVTLDEESETYDCWWKDCLDKYVCAIDWSNPWNGSRRDIGIAAAERGEIVFRGFDQTSCEYGPNWTDWSEPVPYFRADNSLGICPSPSPSPDPLPPNPEPGTWWDLTCECETADSIQNQIVTSDVELDGCIYSEADFPLAGAQTLCNFAAARIRDLGGNPTVCALDEYADTGVGPCMSGVWNFAG